MEGITGKGDHWCHKAPDITSFSFVHCDCQFEYMCMPVTECVCRLENSVKSVLSFYLYTWVPGIKLRSSGLCSKPPCPLSHNTDLQGSFCTRQINSAGARKAEDPRVP